MMDYSFLIKTILCDTAKNEIMCENECNAFVFVFLTVDFPGRKC